MRLRKSKAFCESQLSLHGQQPENEKQNVNVAPPGKIYVDAHGEYRIHYNILFWKTW